MFVQTPQRPRLGATSTPYTAKPVLPPLSLLLSKEVLPLPATDRPRLPSIDTFTTPVAISYKFPGSSPIASTPSKSKDMSMVSDDTPNTSVDEPVIKKRKSSATSPQHKAFAFISHSPATYPSQEPSIDNAPLARRKRRRTSPNELAILNSEFEIGSTPNKARRIEIAKKVNMTEKAVQIWFQNKRQSLRKQSNVEKEVTELPPTPDTSLVMMPQVAPVPGLISSTPTKPLIHRYSSQPFLQSPPMHSHKPMSPANVRPSSTSVLDILHVKQALVTPKSTSATPLVDSIDTSNITGLVLNETKKKQPHFLNSTLSTTMTFKLAPAKVAVPKERKPLGALDANTNVGKKSKPDSECVENLLSLRLGQWA